MNFFIHSFVDELRKFDYTYVPKHSTFNGIKESQGHEFYFYKILRPILNDFADGIRQFYLSGGMGGEPKELVISHFRELQGSIQAVIEDHSSNKAYKNWNKEIQKINIGKLEYHTRLRSLRFLINSADTQLFVLNEAKQLVENLINEIASPKQRKRPRNITLATKFILTETYSDKKNRMLLKDLRQDLILIEKLKKEDTNNTITNFMALFRTKKESDDKEVKPIRFHGYANELKHLIKILQKVLIEPNYSSHSNNHIAFSVFRDKEGNKFKVKKVRWEARPADDRATKIESVLSGLKVRTPESK